jgi:small subunit ribosomal protein S17
MKNKAEEIKVSKKKTLEGTVVSNKMTNAVVVSVSRRMPHPKYDKIITKLKKYYARNEQDLQVGDVVVIEETRPLSKLIRWQVIAKK